MVSSYLRERLEILSGIIRENKNKVEHNKIVIEESQNKINEVKNTVDEASKIFSVKAREDSQYQSHEIKELEEKIISRQEENKKFLEIINDKQEELNRVQQCLSSVENVNVSRETLIKIDQQQEMLINSNVYSENMHKENYKTNYDNDELVAKLKLCKNLSRVDIERLNIELDNIINILSK